MNTDTPSPSEAGQSEQPGVPSWEATKEKASEALHTGERYVREHPGTSTFSMLGIGFLLGALVGWSLAHETHDDYTTSARNFIKRWGHKLNLD